MILKEPVAEFVQLAPNDICAQTGAAYNVCQFVGPTSVSCSWFGGSVTRGELCGQSACAGTSADTNSSDVWNDDSKCDFDSTP